MGDVILSKTSLTWSNFWFALQDIPCTETSGNQTLVLDNGKGEYPEQAAQKEKKTKKM